ncbi:MAG: orotidine-5'-phosphate decarboxylase [Candidatus Margulisiibacteriota bacterium]
MSFFAKLAEVSQKNRSWLCVGLDPIIENIPETIRGASSPILEFNKALIDATIDLVCAYKPNSAFYEQYGLPGLKALQETIAYIGGRVPVILDVKRSDIGHTAQAYAKAAFNEFGADAVTVNPLLGYDSLEPFLDYKDKGIFVLGLTSNKGAEDFEKLMVVQGERRLPLYSVVIEKVKVWNKNNNLGLVAGATNPGELAEIRKMALDMWFLIPGIGAQGGDLPAVLKASVPDRNNPRIIINASRNIIFASKGKDFAEAARNAAIELNSNIRRG